jgi:hypothetical protein
VLKEIVLLLAVTYLQDEEYKKFWEELLTHFPFNVRVILVSDTASKKKSLICMRSEDSKTIQFGRLHGMMELFMKCAVKMTSDGIIYISNFMKMDSKHAICAIRTLEERRNIFIRANPSSHQRGCYIRTMTVKVQLEKNFSS